MIALTGTTISFVAIACFVMIATGIYGLLILADGDDDLVPSLTDYAIVAALISAGLGLGVSGPGVAPAT